MGQLSPLNVEAILLLPSDRKTQTMARPRKKKRTHVPIEDGAGKPGRGNRRPRSMVIRMGAGDIGPSVTQLAKDFRAVMEPDTASRLKVWSRSIAILSVMYLS